MPARRGTAIALKPGADPAGPLPPNSVKKSTLEADYAALAAGKRVVYQIGRGINARYGYVWVDAWPDPIWRPGMTQGQFIDSVMADQQRAAKGTFLDRAMPVLIGGAIIAAGGVALAGAIMSPGAAAGAGAAAADTGAATAAAGTTTAAAAATGTALTPSALASALTGGGGLTGITAIDTAIAGAGAKALQGMMPKAPAPQLADPMQAPAPAPAKGALGLSAGAIVLALLLL